MTNRLIRYFALASLLTAFMSLAGYNPFRLIEKAMDPSVQPGQCWWYELDGDTSIVTIDRVELGAVTVHQEGYVSKSLGIDFFYQVYDPCYKP